LVLRSVVAVTVSVTSTSCDDGPSVHPRVEGEGRGCVEVGLRRGGVRIAVRGEELDIQNVVSWACAMRYGGATSGGWAARPWSGHAMVGRTVRRHRGFRPSSGAHQSVRAHRLPQALHLRVGGTVRRDGRICETRVGCVVILLETSVSSARQWNGHRACSTRIERCVVPHHVPLDDLMTGERCAGLYGVLRLHAHHTRQR
jgi:hypothetical protein